MQQDSRSTHPVHGTTVHRVEVPDGAVIEVFATRYGTVAISIVQCGAELSTVAPLIGALRAAQAEAAQYATDTPELASPTAIASAREPMAHLFATAAEAHAAAPAAPASPSDVETDVVVWADGGSRGNPGPAGYGAVVTDRRGAILAEVWAGIGWATNNVAEYRGVLAGLRRAWDLGARRVVVRADSLLVVNQQLGRWQVRDEGLRPLAAEARRLAQGFDQVIFEHVPRERNQHADSLANRAMDDQGPVSPPLGGGDAA
jgi:ribonuclease HI